MGDGAAVGVGVGVGVKLCNGLTERVALGLGEAVWLGVGVALWVGAALWVGVPPWVGAAFWVGAALRAGVELWAGLALWVGTAADAGVPVGACDVGAAAELLWEGRVGLPGDAAELAELPPEDGMLAVPLNRPLAVGDAEPVDVGLVLPDCGEKIAGMDEEGPAVQADTDRERRTVTVAQPAAISPALLTLMRPPCTRQAAA